MLAVFGMLSAIFPVLAGYPYIRDILRHTTKPHRASFLIWTALGLIALFTQMAKGATWSLLLPAGDTATVFVIFLLSIKHGMGGFSKRDRLGLVLACLGLILWAVTRQPLAALLIVIAIDTIGTILTLIKTYKDPASETFSSWLLSCLGGVFACFAVGRLSFALLIYPIYIIVANGAVDLAILAGKRT